MLTQYEIYFIIGYMFPGKIAPIFIIVQPALSQFHSSEPQ